MPKPPTSDMTTDLVLLLAVISVLLLLAGAAAGETTAASLSPPSPPPPPPPPPPPARKAARSRSSPRSPPAAAAAPTNCSDELVSFSKCLPYASSSPNNASKSPSRQCCHDVASTFASGDAVCFCYLIKNPNLLGFPLNSTRVLSLTSLCPMRVHGANANFSLSSLCSRTHNLPPLKSITSPEHSRPRTSGRVNPTHLNPPPPHMENLTQNSQESTGDSDSPAYSNTSAPADTDTTVPANSDTPPTLPLIPAWRTFSTNAINSRSGWLLPLIMAVIDVAVAVLA